MDQLLSIISMAVVVEAIVTYISEIRSWKSPLVYTTVLGIIVAVTYGLDIPYQLGIASKVPYIGEVLTGIILSRGSNYLYDLIGKMTMSNKTEKSYHVASPDKGTERKKCGFTSSNDSRQKN